eukprot:scaffold157033_cov32-Tisochrysis_lutea.AAC.1
MDYVWYLIQFRSSYNPACIISPFDSVQIGYHDDSGSLADLGLGPVFPEGMNRRRLLYLMGLSGLSNISFMAEVDTPYYLYLLAYDGYSCGKVDILIEAELPDSFAHVAAESPPPPPYSPLPPP